MSDDELGHFTVELSKSSEVFIYLDKTNLDWLIKELQSLKNPGDHKHYMSENWGVGDLTPVPFQDKHQLSDHLQFILIEPKEIK